MKTLILLGLVTILGLTSCEKTTESTYYDWQRVSDVTYTDLNSGEVYNKYTTIDTLKQMSESEITHLAKTASYSDTSAYMKSDLTWSKRVEKVVTKFNKI
jgi:hypothetical protein